MYIALHWARCTFYRILQYFTVYTPIHVFYTQRWCDARCTSRCTFYRIEHVTLMWRRCYHSQPSLCTSPPRCNYTNLQYKSIMNFRDSNKKALLLLSPEGSVYILKRQSHHIKMERHMGRAEWSDERQSPILYWRQLTLGYILIATIDLCFFYQNKIQLSFDNSWVVFNTANTLHVLIEILLSYKSLPFFNIKRQNTALHHYSEQYHRKCRAKEWEGI